MKVLVTGGAGFIGSHTVDVLIEKGHEVIIIDKLKTTNFYIHEDAVFYQTDITNEEEVSQIFSVHQPDAMIHLAAQVDVATSLQAPAYDVRTNIEGTLILLEQCRKFNTKVVFASSAAVYGIPEELPIDEEHRQAPLSVYGLSKLSAEKYIALYNEIYGNDYCILRYSNVYGPRQDASGEGGVVSIFVDRLLKGETPVIYGDGLQTRDFIYVKDLARANVLAVEKGENQILNISSGTETSVNDLLDKITAIVKTTIEPNFSEPRTGDITRSVLGASKAEGYLGWSAQTSLEEGLKDTVNFIKNKNLSSVIPS